MAAAVPPSRPPTATELLADPTVQLALEEAWIDSQADDPLLRHEEGGWIYLDVANGTIALRRTAPGGQDHLDLDNPPAVSGSVVVGTFHTHPNPKAEGWESGPSPADQLAAVLSGVPWLIRADDGYHHTGPEERRGGLTGRPGFPL
jgi:hypothetical protein